MENEVPYYKKFIAHIPVYFPNGKDGCRYCSFIRYEQPFSRYFCKAVLGYNWIDELSTRPEWCPLEERKSENE